MTLIAPTTEAFFTDRLAAQRKASPHTITAYRDSLKLLLGFASRHAGKPASRPVFADLDATVIGAFLDHLERDRAATARTRNARLAAIRSLFAFAALRHPEHAALIQRVLAIPGRRHDRTDVSFLTRKEAEALIAAPTSRPGQDAATTPCWPWPPRPVCGSPNSPRCAARTSTLAPAPTSPAPARAARSAAPRSPRRPQR